MKCFNCKVEIPSQFTIAIKNNSCPSCGNNIYSDGLIDELSKVIEEKASNSKELALYLITKYQFQSPEEITTAPTEKVDEEVVEKVKVASKKTYVPKPISRSEDGENSAPAKEVTPFFARTGIVPKSSKDIQAVAHQIISQDDLEVIGDEIDDDVGLNDNSFGAPLEESEDVGEMGALFEHHTSPTLELEKLKRLQNTGTGAFKKSE